MLRSIRLRPRTKFRQAENGTVAITFSLTMVAAIAVVGLAVDYGNAVAIRYKAQAALDSAALAYVQNFAATHDANASEARARALLSANLPDATAWNWQFSAAQLPTRNRTLINISGTSSAPTTFSKIVGQNSFTLNVASQSQIAIKSTSVVLAADISWSMVGAPMASMKTAMKSFAKVMYEIDPMFARNLKISLVPYAGAVNIKDQAANAYPLLTGLKYKPNLSSIWPRNPFYRPVTTVLGDYMDKIRVDMSTGQPRLLTGRYRFNGADWSYVSEMPLQTELVWNHCTMSLNSEFGNDDVPAVQTVPVHPIALYSSTTIPYCPNNNTAVTVDVPDRATFDAKVDQYDIAYSTRHDVGLLWAERILSPKWTNFFGTESRPWNEPEFPKYVIFLSDGDSRNIFLGGAYASVSDEDVGANALKVCSDLKSKGVTVIAISYAAGSANGGVIPLLEQCASSLHFSRPS